MSLITDRGFPDELYIERSGEPPDNDAPLDWSIYTSLEDAALDDGVFIGVYKLVRVGRVKTRTELEPVEGDPVKTKRKAAAR